MVIKSGFAEFTVYVGNLWDQFLFKPSSPFKIKWDIIIIIFSIWNALEIPFVLAFPFTLKNNPGIEITDNIIDVLFWFDILVNFRTCYIDIKTDTLIDNPKQISRNYLNGRFWLDLLASLPFESI